MVTIGELLSIKFFHNFRFATKKVGLSNTITAAGFFEWETKEDIKSSFRKGEFIVTTLSSAKDDDAYAQESLRTLIANGASAIAIKDIYFKNVSDNIKQFAELNDVPIFFFSDIYIDDVLFNVKILLLQESSNPAKVEKVNKLLNDNRLTSTSKTKMIYSLNPHFIDGKVMCSYITTRDGTPFDVESKMNDFVNGELGEKHSKEFDPSTTVYMFIPYMSGLMLLYTGSDRSSLSQESSSQFLKRHLSDDEEYFIGISTIYDKLNDIDYAMKESIYASAISNINNESITLFNSASFDHMLCSICYTPWSLKFYDEIDKKINDVSASTQKQLFETLTAYVESEGDISLVSKLLYQHSNTIRYRLTKVKNLLDIESDPVFFNQAYAYIYFNKIRKLLDPIFSMTS